MQTTKTPNINYTKLPREEVYQDRDDINDFDIDTPDSIEKRMLICIYNSRIIELDDAERNIIEIFNTAHYIAIVLLAQQNPMMSFSWCFKVAGQIGKSPNGEANPDNKLFVAATMGIVVNYMKICDPQYRREENMLICRIAQYFDDLLGITDESVKLFRECCKFVPVEVIDKACNLMSREDFRPLNQLPANVKTEETQNTADIQYVSETSSKNIERDARIIELKQENQELREIILESQARTNLMKKKLGQRNNVQIGLTPTQCIIFGNYIVKKLNLSCANKKDFAPLLNALFGWGTKSLSNKMSDIGRDEDLKHVADIFAHYSPAIAKEIYSDWNESMLTPWPDWPSKK